MSVCLCILVTEGLLPESSKEPLKYVWENKKVER